MVKSIKRYILITLLATSLVPLLIFGIIFFSQTNSYLVQKNTEYINFILEREKKHIEDFVQININDMSIIALSRDIKGQKQDEIIGIFSRFLSARKDYDKIKYVYPDGKIIEVNQTEGGVSYRKDPLSVSDVFCLENGAFAIFSGMEEGKPYIIYSFPVVINGESKGVITGYMPTSNLNFLTIADGNSNLGRIYIKDSRDRFVTPIVDGIDEAKGEIDVPIERTDWRIYASINRMNFAFSTLKVIFSNTAIFFLLVIVAIIPIALYISDYLTRPMNEFINSARTLTKVGGRSPIFYNNQEGMELRKNFNKMIDIIEINKPEIEERAYIDKLTGLYNQRFMEERLRDKVHFITNKKIYFLMMGVNVSGDSEAEVQRGVFDMALSEIGSIITDYSRFMDIPIRFSQREFLIVLSGIDIDKTLDIANNMVTEIENHQFVSRDAEIKLKAQFGIAEYRGDIGRAIDESSQVLKGKRKNSIIQ